MAKTRVAVEFGMGTSLRRRDYTKAAVSALKDALWHNSLNMADAFGFDKSAMIVDVEVAVQQPDQVDIDALLTDAADQTVLAAQAYFSALAMKAAETLPSWSTSPSTMPRAAGCIAQFSALQ